jgi:hypothetical protein
MMRMPMLCGLITQRGQARREQEIGFREVESGFGGRGAVSSIWDMGGFKATNSPSSPLTCAFLVRGA